MLSRLIRLPPVLALAFLLAGLAGHRFYPLPLGIPSFRVGMGVGCGLLALGIALAWNALSELKRHHTTVEPGQRPSALVTSGIFSFTRNPSYITLLLVLISLAVMVDSLWLVAGTGLLWLTLDRVVVRAEEKILEEEFPQDFRAYKSRVRRWA